MSWLATVSPTTGSVANKGESNASWQSERARISERTSGYYTRRKSVEYSPAN